MNDWIKCCEYLPSDEDEYVLVTDGKYLNLARYHEKPFDYFDEDEIESEEIYLLWIDEETCWQIEMDIGTLTDGKESLYILEEITYWMHLPRPPYKNGRQSNKSSKKNITNISIF